MHHIVGVDEAGRGALAGPVAVGAAMVPPAFDWSLIPGVRDSKQLSPARREAIFLRTRQLVRDGVLSYAVSMVGAGTIDRIGITAAVSRAGMRALARLSCDPASVAVRLDGLLRAPAQYVRQETIIRGDQTESIISLASIMAKVTRDRYMVRLARRYEHYRFEVHKGYGTKVHKEMIAVHGLCTLHRRSFCRFASAE